MNATLRVDVALALAFVTLLAGCESGPKRKWTAPGPAPTATLSPEEALPGIDLSGLDPAQRQAVVGWAQAAFPYCGAPRTVSAALRKGGCRHAPRMARHAARLAASGITDREKLALAVTDYYASFDPRKRATLHVAAFGPPLGAATAPVALVEFSDFTCPGCQMFRPILEKFVADRPGRVRLHFKPYPIETHVNALEAAQAAEWARDQGAFWKMHDTLFENPYAYDPDSLVSYAAALGLDGADLAEALASGRYLAKVRGSMAEAKAAGLRATPTLFLNGRMYRMLSFGEDDLEFTLEDEEEWMGNGGWIRD